MFVFTPKGEVMALPAGSTPVDFAYAVHTEVGHRTIGARVNGKLVPLNSELNHGDWVEIFTSKAEGAGPSQDWQHFVKSARARNKIRQWFSKERREEAIDRGKDLLTKAMRKQNLPLQRLMTHDALAAIAEDFKYADISGLYAGVGDGHTSAQSVMERLVESLGGNEHPDDDLTEVSIPTAGQQGPVLRLRRRGPRRGRRLGEACPVLHPGPAGSDPGLRHARLRGLRAPDRLHQRQRPDGPAGQDRGG